MSRRKDVISMIFEPERCPKCGGPPAGIRELVPGIALLSTTDEVQFEYAGETELWWSEQYTDEDANHEVQLFCQRCKFFWEAYKKEN